MKQTTRLLALSAIVLAVVLAAIGAPALNAPSVAFAQQVPAAPVITAQRSGADTINLTWTPVTGAVSYELYAHHPVTGWMRLDGGAADPLTANTFPHTGLEIDTLYHYQVRGVNAQGNVGAYSARANEVAGQNAPDRPSLTATAGYQVITVTWPAVTNATSYVLYAWDQTWSLIDTVTGTSYPHTGLTVGQTYYYQARAMNANGVLGALSALANATVLASPNISEPSSFNAARGDEQVTLTWGAPANTAGLTIARYEYRYVESGGAFPTTWPDAVNVLTVTVPGLDNGTQYNFEVRAVSETDAVGNTASRSATPSTVPGAPTLTATAGYQRIVLSWTAPTSNGGAAITSYRIERENDDGMWGSPATVPGSVLTRTFTGLQNATEYTYRIFAINVAGDSDWTSASAITLANPISAPGSPTGLTPTAGHGSVTLTWTEPVFNGGAAVTAYSYRYTKADPAPTNWTGWFGNGTDLMVEISPLDPGVEYDFEVTATNSAGTGPAAEASATPRATAPTAAPSLTATLARDSSQDSNNREQVRIEYRNIKDSANGGDGIDGYELQWKADDEDWAEAGEEITAASPTNQNEDVLITRYHPPPGGVGDTLAPGTTYTYRVRAYNDADGTTAGQSPDDDGAAADQVEENGPWSAERSVKTDAIAPTVPVLNPIAGLEASNNVPALPAWTIDVNSITVRWTEPATGGSPITSYQLEVRNDPIDEDNSFTMPADEPNDPPVDRSGNTRISNLPASRTWYTHSGLKASSVYYYRIRALNDADGDGRPGEEGEVSIWSGASADVTTLGATLGTHAAPGSPTANAATDPGLTHRIVVTWPVPVVPQGVSRSPVTRYEIQWQQSDNADDDTAGWDDAETLVPNPPTNTTLDHNNREGAKRYVYRVRAINSAGNSPWSDNGFGTTEARAPGDIMLDASAVGATEILLEWNVPADNGSNFAGYEIQRWNPNAAPPAWGDDIAVTDADTTVFTDRGDLTGDGDFDDDGELQLLAGTTYSYRIRTTGATPGNLDTDFPAVGVEGAMASATTAAGAPGKPTLEAAEGKDVGSITLTISMVSSGATSLELTRYENGQWNPITGNDAPAADAKTYTDSGLTPGVKYYYALRASNSFGTGQWSDVVNAVATAANPDKITTLTPTATGENTIRLTWTEPANNGKTITGYALAKFVDGGTEWVPIPTTDYAATDTVTEFIDTGLTAGETYHYRIRALVETFVDTNDDQDTSDEGWSAEDFAENASGEDDPPKGTVSATTHGATPSAPGTLRATAGTQSTGLDTIGLTWDAPDSDNGFPVTGYSLYKWNGSAWVVHEANLPATPRSYTDRDLTRGSKHYYILRAMNSQGAGAWSSFATATVMSVAPDAPVLTATTRDTNSIQLTWTEAVLNGTASFTGYMLQRWDGNSFETIVVGGNNLMLDMTITLYVDTGRNPGEENWYRIRVLATPMSAWSAVASDTTVAAPPGRPTVTATAADADITHNSVKLTWKGPDIDSDSSTVGIDADSFASNGSAVIHYEVQMWDTTAQTWSRLALISATHTEYTHRNLSPETRYVYRVRAQNRAPGTAGGFGSWSTIIAATTTAEPKE